ncbi:hypothetical protein Bca101_054482 [Brassica carinata]
MLTSHGSRLELLLLNKKRSSVKLLLPDEVIELILERLPVMSLLRFKSVSKNWKSTVEDRRFQERQLICRKQSRGPDFLFLSLRDDDQNIKNAPIIFSSCDGLVCLYDTRVGVVVANPATRWYQTFPLARIQQLLNHMSVSPVPKLGFGKDKLKGTYKPVFLYNSFGFGLDNVTTCELFDVSTNAWRYVRPASPYRINAYNNPVYFDGSLYWLTELEEKVLSFDLQSESFQVICKAPIAHVRDPSSVCMCILDNSLCVSENNRFTLKIWSLDCSGGNTKTWKKLCSLDLTSRSCFGKCALLPIAILDKTKLLLGSSHECTQQLGFMDVVVCDLRGVDGIFVDRGHVDVRSGGHGTCGCGYQQKRVVDVAASGLWSVDVVASGLRSVDVEAAVMGGVHRRVGVEVCRDVVLSGLLIDNRGVVDMGHVDVVTSKNELWMWLLAVCGVWMWKLLLWMVWIGKLGWKSAERRLLSYPRGTKHVKCSCCQTVNLVLEVTVSMFLLLKSIISMQSSELDVPPANLSQISEKTTNDLPGLCSKDRSKLSAVSDEETRLKPCVDQKEKEAVSDEETRLKPCVDQKEKEA